MTQEFTPQYSQWRHGGWYVHNIRWPNGGCGCVSNNYPDKKWRIVCHPDPDGGPTFKTRDEAAKAELKLVSTMEVTAA
jgi:hypothetical protein